MRHLAKSVMLDGAPEHVVLGETLDWISSGGGAPGDSYRGGTSLEQKCWVRLLEMNVRAVNFSLPLGRNIKVLGLRKVINLASNAAKGSWKYRVRGSLRVSLDVYRICSAGQGCYRCLAWLLLSACTSFIVWGRTCRGRRGLGCLTWSLMLVRAPSYRNLGRHFMRF